MTYETETFKPVPGCDCGLCERAGPPRYPKQGKVRVYANPPLTPSEKADLKFSSPYIPVPVEDSAERKATPVVLGVLDYFPLAIEAERKATPVTTGVLDYFPLAIEAVARLSRKGNDKHNPGEPLHWNRPKSSDHADCLVRHLLDRGKIDPSSGELHDAAVAWRALALLQLAEEKRLDRTD